TSGINNFNGGFVDVNRRFRTGLAFRTNYTFGRSLDNASAITGTQAGGQNGVVMDTEDRKRDYGRSAFDVRHWFSLNGMYELPVGKGKPFFERRPRCRGQAGERLAAQHDRQLAERLP